MICLWPLEGGVFVVGDCGVLAWGGLSVMGLPQWRGFWRAFSVSIFSALV